MKESLFFLMVICFVLVTRAQESKIELSKYPPIVTFTADQDHDNMMKQLGITDLRPGPSGNDADPNHANTDESLANPCPKLPEILITKSAKKVTTSDQWWLKEKSMADCPKIFQL